MVADNWKRMSLGEFVTLQRGHDLPEGRRRSGKVPILGSFGITGWHDEARTAGPGVTVGRSGASFGVVTYSATDFWPLNTALYVIDFHGNDERFAYYFLKHFDFRGYNSGSAQPSLNRNFVHPVPVEIPPIPEQRAISQLLGSLDDKIELNRRMNETLEGIARTMFKSWFVDFDPVRAKMEGRQNGMSAETAALFSDSFSDSELGLIPESWGFGALEELVSLARNTVNPSIHPDEAFDHYSIPAYDERKLPRCEYGYSIRSNKFVVPGGSVLISRLNPRIPRVWLPAVSNRIRSICSTEFAVVQPKEPRDREFLYALFSSPGFIESFASLVTGTSGSHQRVRPEEVFRLRVVIPRTQIRSAFGELARPLLERVAGNLAESKTLGELRDTLLPKLISGEIRLSDAKSYAEAAI